MLMYVCMYVCRFFALLLALVGVEWVDGSAGLEWGFYGLLDMYCIRYIYVKGSFFFLYIFASFFSIFFFPLFLLLFTSSLLLLIPPSFALLRFSLPPLFPLH